MNTQPIEKQIRQANSKLDVHSVFYTIQGEGPYVGRPAVFVRMAGCNLQCPLCDTEYTDPLQRRMLRPQELVPIIEDVNRKAGLVVITGGEPFRQDISQLVRMLHFRGFAVQVETNGTLYLDDFPFGCATIVCSPKAGRVHPKLVAYVDAYKYVLGYGRIAEDGLPWQALDHPSSPRVARPHKGFKGTVYVQPIDEDRSDRNQQNLEATVESALTHGYTLGIQLHKLIGKE